MTVVVGGGITGLATAAFLAAAGREVVVLEPGRPGGVVGSVRRDGFLCELGAGSVRGGNPAIGALLALLGLTPVKASPAAAARYLVSGGRLVPLPGPIGALWTPLWGPHHLARALVEPLFPRGDDAPRSVDAFVRARVGSMADLLDPLMAGIYAGDPSQLDAETAMARPWGWVRDHGSLLGGALRAPRGTEPTGSFTFAEGLGELVDALVARVGDALRPAAARALAPGVDGVRVETDAGDLHADDVVVTCAPEVAARLLPDLALPPLPRAPVLAVHLGYAPGAVDEVRGFGWLCPSRERRDVLGCLWVSATFPTHAPPGAALFRVMAGGARDPARVELSDEAAVDHARAVLREVQGVTADPVTTHVHRSVPGIPQYPVGWGRALRGLRSRPRVHFSGWYWGGIGIADGIAAAAGPR